MHILTFILMFVFGSIAYAFKGDYSGLVANRKIHRIYSIIFHHGFYIDESSVAYNRCYSVCNSFSRTV